MPTITTGAETGVPVACRECSRPACGPVPAEPLIVDVAWGIESDA